MHSFSNLVTSLLIVSNICGSSFEDKRSLLQHHAACAFTQGEAQRMLDLVGARQYLDRWPMFSGIDGPGLCTVLDTSTRVQLSADFMWQHTPLGYPGVDSSKDTADWTLPQMLSDFGSYCLEARQPGCFVDLLGAAAKLVEPVSRCYYHRIYSRVFMGLASAKKNLLGTLDSDTVERFIAFLYDLAAREDDKEWLDLTLYALGQALAEVGRQEESLAVFGRLLQVGTPLPPHATARCAEGSGRSQCNVGAEGGSARSPQSLVIITLATDAKAELGHLLSSIQLASDEGIGVLVVGLGVPWEGFFAKVNAVLPAVEGLPPDQLVLYTDAYDSLVFPPILGLAQAYEATGAEVIFAAEPVCMPDLGVQPLAMLVAQRRQELGHALGPYNCLCAGQFVGTAGAIGAMLREVLSYRSSCATFDDQRGMTQFYLAHPDKVHLDVSARLFLCMEMTPPKEYHMDPEEALLVFSHNGTTVHPAVGHGNGLHGKAGYKRMLDALLVPQTVPTALSLGKSIMGEVASGSAHTELDSAHRNQLLLAQSLFLSAAATHPHLEEPPALAQQVQVTLDFGKNTAATT